VDGQGLRGTSQTLGRPTASECRAPSDALTRQLQNKKRERERKKELRKKEKKRRKEKTTITKALNLSLGI
jgi:hypothetical protein